MLYLNEVVAKSSPLATAFNFNKCCIWIRQETEDHVLAVYLTLTSVVFESDMSDDEINQLDLTLTSVVFEYRKII